MVLVVLLIHLLRDGFLETKSVANVNDLLRLLLNIDVTAFFRGWIGPNIY